MAYAAPDPAGLAAQPDPRPGETDDHTFLAGPGKVCVIGISRCMRPGYSHNKMEAFLVSTGIVALAEMGDKTQLLSLVLAARIANPFPSSSVS